MYKTVLPLLVSGLALSSCATEFAQADSQKSHALLNFVNEPFLKKKFKAGFQLDRDYQQKYVAVHDHSCKASAKFARFTELGRDHKPVRVMPDKAVNILAYNAYTDGHVVGSSATEISEGCKSIASFVPRKGGNYIVRLTETETEECEMFVIDYETKAAPSDLEITNEFKCE